MSGESELKAFKDKWEHGPLQKAFNKQKEQKEKYQTDSGIEIRPVYTPLDLEESGFNYIQDLGLPGEYPFTRGTNPLGYRQNLWVMGQYAGYGDAEATNKRFQFLLEKGQTGISVALDLPTQLGYDSDNPLAEGEVGKVGVSIDSLQDVELIFQGIPLDRPRQISTTANAIGPIWLAMLIVLAEQQGVSPENCVLRVQNDILKEYIARGTYIFPPQPSVSMSTDVITYCAEYYPHWFPLTVCGYHIREAGANAAQEIAFTIANAITYIDDAICKGVSPERFISQFSVMLSVSMDFFEEIAKFRAMRRLWARTLRKRYSIDNLNLLRFNLIHFTAGSSLTAQQPMNNIVRVAIESLAAVLGGGNTLYPCSYDEAYCTPTESAVKVALRTQQIVAHETGVTSTVDPLAGSYYLEHLTNKLESLAEVYLSQVQELGGSINAISEGYFEREIVQSAYNIKRNIEDKNRIIVGVNDFIDEEELPITLLKVDPILEQRQKERVKKLKMERDNVAVGYALNLVKESAIKHENLIPSLISAVRVYATIGEICDALREVYGQYTTPVWR